MNTGESARSGEPRQSRRVHDRQLAEEVIKTCESKSSFTYMPLPADDPRQRKPDITRAQTLLGWNPTIPLREGLKKTVEDFKTESVFSHKRHKRHKIHF